MLETMTGDGLKMGIWAGAAVEESPHCAMLHFNSTNEKPVIHYRPVGMMNRGAFLYVNKLGERIIDESLSDEFIANIVLRQPGKSFFQVFDAKWVVDQNRADVEKSVATGAVLQADTIEELAPKFGADGAVFRATVERYNELVKLGQDLDFGKKSNYMTIPVEEPPFYVCESPPDLLCVMGGFKRDADGQVLDNDMEVIPGLYAAGNITGSFWGDTYPMGFLGGISRSHALVFGRLAGLHAAGCTSPTTTSEADAS
jgi:fumarate reductase flavoprotein subunit